MESWWKSLRAIEEKKVHANQSSIGFCKIVLILTYGLTFWIITTYLFWDQIQSFTITKYYKNYTDLLDDVDVDCSGIIKGDIKISKKAKMMIYNTTIVQKLILDAADRCVAIRSLFGFDNKPISQEEIDYPLAYGLVVYKNSVQHRPEISWGSFEIINSTYACLQVLANSTTPWKYFQYLSGVDIPLKTNLEMIKIFKQWNDTINVEITRFQKQRINGKSINETPLPLFKSSLSATLPRVAVDKIVKSPESRELLHFLQNTSIPDESFWATISGNVDKFPIPGGTHAERWLQYREQYRTNHYKELELFEKTKHRMRYYLSRFQEWQGSGCSGKLASGSCVFGVDDLTDLLKQPHLVAHKFYIDFESAAYFCGLKEIRSRESKPLQLDVTPYGKIPQVELSSGVSFENLTNPLWLF